MRATPQFESTEEMWRWEREKQMQRLRENLDTNPTTWEGIISGLGRNNYPFALDVAVADGHITDLDEIAKAIEDAWTSAEFPMAYLRRTDWLDYFSMVGYLENTTRVDRPIGPPRLYRGSLASTRRRWSWTSDLDRAQWFADRIGEEGHLWTVLAPPKSLLAHFHEARSEAEYVVNTKGLKIMEHTNE